MSQTRVCGVLQSCALCTYLLFAVQLHRDVIFRRRDCITKVGFQLGRVFFFFFSGAQKLTSAQVIS